MTKRISKLLIILGIIFLNFKNFESYEYKITNKIKVNYYFNVKKEEYKTDNYLAILEIPKINLKQGIYDINSTYNDVDKNIYVLKETSFPNNLESHIILAAHSGYGYQAFFNNLNKLNINDNIYFYYNNYKYIYEIKDIYEVAKTGKIDLKMNYQNDINLITCIYNTNKQIVYTGELIKYISTHP